VRFLESKKWLNVYQITAMEVGSRSGLEFRRIVRKKLKDGYKPRREFESLLTFRVNTHYAALKIGGQTGPRNGTFYVRFGPNAPLLFATVFAGDPLRMIYL